MAEITSAGPMSLTKDPSLKVKVPVAQASLGGALVSAAPQIAGMATSYYSPGSQQYRKDVEALRKGKLGFSAAQKRGMLGAAMRGAEAQTKDIEAGLRRESAAQGGTGRSGRKVEAIGELSKAKLENIRKAFANIEGLSQQQTSTREAAIKNQMEARRREGKQDATQLAQTGIAGAAYGAQKMKEEQKKLGTAGIPDMTQAQKEEYANMGEEEKAAFVAKLQRQRQRRAAGRSALSGGQAALGIGEQSSLGETMFGMPKETYSALSDSEKAEVRESYTQSKR